MEEIWKDIKDYEGYYQVSNLGRVKSLERDVICKDGRVFHYKERILKPITSTWGYYFVNLLKECKLKSVRVHRLVAEAFLPNPDNLPEVNHKVEEDKTYNIVFINEDGTIDTEKTSLEWCTKKYNVNYGTRINRVSCALTNRVDLSKVVLQFSLSGEFIKEFSSGMEAYRQTGVSSGHISQCCYGKRKTAGGFIWRYKNIA